MNSNSLSPYLLTALVDAPREQLMYLTSDLHLGGGLSSTSTPDSLRDGYMTQVWLADGTEPGSDITGAFLFHQQVETSVNDLVHDTDSQDQLMAAFVERTGVALN